MASLDDRFTVPVAIRRWQPSWTSLRRALDAVAEDEDIGDATELAHIRKTEREAWEWVKSAHRGPDERGLMRSPDTITVELPRSVALILDAWLGDHEDPHFFASVTDDRPTRYALNQLGGALDPTLAETFRPDYDELLDAARREANDATCRSASCARLTGSCSRTGVGVCTRR